MLFYLSYTNHLRLMLSGFFKTQCWIKIFSFYSSYSGPIQYRILQRIVGSRRVSKVLVSLWTLTSALATVLLRCLSNFKAIWNFNHRSRAFEILRYWILYYYWEWRCCKNFSQREHSFNWKLCCHWLKLLRQRQIAVVIQSPEHHPLGRIWKKNATE